MKNQNHYVMQDQVKNQVPSLMSCDVTLENRSSETQLHLVAVAVVTTIYLLAMTFSG
ncbi:MAG: hypothetical protein GY696_06325 [Gammaproteobacteria bacterium]|nr:hypothetical protein [Gammaproteobacteria bacterium]MCP4996810.1 hypothetical protein [Gammaproteobacteria bacterium]